MLLQTILCRHLKATLGKSYKYWLARLISEIKSLGLEEALEIQKAREQMLKTAIMTGKVEFEQVSSRKVITHYVNNKPIRQRIPKSKPLARLLNTALRCYKENDFQSQFAKKIFRFIKTSNIYRFDEVTPTQFQKAKDDITTPLTEEQILAVHDIIIETKQNLEEERQYLFDRVHALEYENPNFVPNMLQFSLTSKSAPYLKGDGKIVHSAPNLTYRTRDPKTMLRWCKTNKIPFSRAKAYAQGLYDINLTENLYRSLDPLPTNVMGKISFIQEPKGKLRVVANPFLFLQLLQEGDKIRYRQVLKALPEVYTFNQELGVLRAIEAMQGGTNTLYCYDCTAFTDRFSLEYQLAVSGFSTQLLNTISKGKWFVKVENNVEEYWTYAAGQPMGLGPSFFLATFAHWCLLATISKRYGFKPLKMRLPFGINGDDVWISDHRIASDYLQTMEDIGVSINLKKSIVSNTAGEFLGQIFNHKGVRVPSIKYRSALTSYPALVNAIKYFGKNYLNLLEKGGIKTALSILPVELGGTNCKLHSIADSLAILSIQLKSMLKEVELCRENLGSLHLYSLFNLVTLLREQTTRRFHTKNNITIISENDNGKSNNCFSISVDFYVNHRDTLTNAYRRLYGDNKPNKNQSSTMDRGIIRSLIMDTVKQVHDDLIVIRDLIESVRDYPDFLDLFSLYLQVNNDFTKMKSTVQDYITHDLPQVQNVKQGVTFIKKDEDHINKEALEKAISFSKDKKAILESVPESSLKDPMAVVKVEAIINSPLEDQTKKEEAKMLRNKLESSTSKPAQAKHEVLESKLAEIMSNIKKTNDNFSKMAKEYEDIITQGQMKINQLLGVNYDGVNTQSTQYSGNSRGASTSDSRNGYDSSESRETNSREEEQRDKTEIRGDNKLPQSDDLGDSQTVDYEKVIKKRR